jgi:hypothetical protein
MKEVISRLENVLYKNVRECESTFANFYKYCNHKLESECKTVIRNRDDFQTINIQNQFHKYMNTEIPKFDARWLVDDYHIND